MTQMIQRKRDVIRCDTDKLDTAIVLGHWTNETLARAARVSTGTIGHLRSGARTTCNKETARKIEKALRLKPGKIFMLEVSNGDSAHAA